MVVERVWHAVVPVLVAVLVVLPGAVAGPSVAATTVRCGDTVTRDVVLTADLVNCPGPGIVVGASNITIDLRGHTIDGAAAVTRYNCDYTDPSQEDFTCSPDPCGGANAEPCGAPHDFVDEVYEPVPGAAIENNGFDAVTVSDGNSTDYAVATYHAVRADRFKIRNVHSNGSGGSGTGSGIGARVEKSASGLATGSTFAGTDVDVSRFQANEGVSVSAGSDNNIFDGNVSVALFGSDHNTIRRTTGGIQVFDGSDKNLVERNVIENSFKPLWLRRSDRNLVRDNTIRGTVEPIFLEDSKGNVVERNTTSGSHGDAWDVILLRSDRNTVRNNTITEAVLREGFRDSGGVLLCGAAHNLVAGNAISGQFVGIDVDNDVACGAKFVSKNNTLRGNSVQRSLGAGEAVEETGDGITVSARALNTVLAGNIVRNNAHHGIDARSRSTVLTNNTAIANGALGINAVPGVIDGGGNVARSNGDPRQCINVVCSR